MNAQDIDNILNNKFIIISVMGEHAGESVDKIFSRKQQEIIDTGKSFWLIRSNIAKTETIQKIGKCASEENIDLFCIFIEASTKKGAMPTINDEMAQEYSNDKIEWKQIPNGIKVTGDITKNSTGIVFGSLDVFKNLQKEIDLWNYSYFLNNSPTQLKIGASTICCIKNYCIGMKSHKRKILAVGKLVEPYAVFLSNEKSKNLKEYF